MMIEKLAVVAVGGNSLIEDPKRPDLSQQWDAVRKTSEEIAKVAARRLDVRPVSEWIVPTAPPKMLPRDIAEASPEEGEDDGHPFF